jgi:hypothetical protein
MIIWFHGTTSGEIARRILKYGFQPNTWFSRHLEDALALGGPHIFEVGFYDYVDAWQMQWPDTISPERIIAYTYFEKKIILNHGSSRLRELQNEKDGSISGFANKVEEHRWPHE